MFSQMLRNTLIFLILAGSVSAAEQRVLRYDATAQGKQASSQIAVDDTYSTGTVALIVPATTSSATTGTLVLSGIANSAAGFAELLGFNPVPSGLTATNVQDAIDELASTPGAVGADPTAQVDGTAVNGVATTFLRSDGAPALADPFTPADGTQNITGSVDTSGTVTVAGTTTLNSRATVNWNQSLGFGGLPGLRVATSGTDNPPIFHGDSDDQPFDTEFIVSKDGSVISLGDATFAGFGDFAGDLDVGVDLTVDGNTTLGNSSADTSTLRGTVTLSDADSHTRPLGFGSSSPVKLWKQGTGVLRTDSEFHSYSVSASNVNTTGMTDPPILVATNNNNTYIAASANGSATNFYSPGLGTFRSRGTAHSPSNIAVGDVIGQWTSRGWNNSSYRDGGLMRFRVESPGASFIQTYFEIQLATTSASLAQRWALYTNRVFYSVPQVDRPTISNTAITISPDTSYVEWGNLTVSNATLANPNISNGVAGGQRLTVVNVSSAYVVTFTDGQNVQLPAGTVTLGPDDAIEFVWSATRGDWICVSYSNN